jgi:glycosyltransferase involved in cell wall biosynthesis
MDEVTSNLENRPKVSVCVVTYNQVNYIRQCLQSIVDQETDFDFEVIVSDDCSTDGTKIIVQEFAELYPGIIKPIYQAKNIGGGLHNFLTVHNRALGIYVAHCDGDDYWYPGKLAYQVSIFEKNRHIVQCWTCADFVNEHGDKVGIFPSYFARILYPKNISTQDIVLSYGLVGQHSTQMYKRSSRKGGLLMERMLDYWVAFIISLSGQSYYSKKIYSAYRVGNNHSITRQPQAKKITVDLLADHLNKIAISYPQYAKKAKANLVFRQFASKISGHDLTIINQVLEAQKNIPINYYYVFKSGVYFLLQKLKCSFSSAH